MNASEVHYDVASYALGVLEPADVDRFEEHLVTCDACALELEALLPLAQERGRGSPMLTTTDGTHEAMVWAVGTSDGRLRAFDGDTGEVLFTSTDTMTGLHSYNTTPILAKGRVFIAADNRVYAYTR